MKITASIRCRTARHPRVSKILVFRKDCGQAVIATRDIIASEKGIALVMVLILSAIALAIMAALVYMLTVSTQVSGFQKRYRTALEAGKGGAQVTYALIGARGVPAIQNINLSVPADTLIVNGQSCLNWKLLYPTSSWPTGSGQCSNSISIDPSDSTTYDMSFCLGTGCGGGLGTAYNVRTKIVDTVDGNSGGDLGLTKSGVVNSNSGEITVVSMPYLYTIEVDAENAVNPHERGKYEVLYEY